MRSIRQRREDALNDLDGNFDEDEFKGYLGAAVIADVLTDQAKISHIFPASSPFKVRRVTFKLVDGEVQMTNETPWMTVLFWSLESYVQDDYAHPDAITSEGPLHLHGSEKHQSYEIRHDVASGVYMYLGDPYDTYEAVLSVLRDHAFEDIEANRLYRERIREIVS